MPKRRRSPSRRAPRRPGSRARIASADEVERATGFAPGAVAPFPLPRVRHVFVDQSLLAHDLLWVGAGSPSHLAAVRPVELVRLTRARSLDAVQEPPYHSPSKGDA